VKVVLAEKPSVARELAAFLKASSRRDGYFEGNGYQVTWALGHLVELKEPADYDPALKKWSLDTLPFVPEKFELKQRGDQRARQQFAVVKRLFRAADGLICATDAGREGELIFRYILTLSGCARKPAQRLWLKSLTPQAIQTAFRSLRPLADYDNLYAAAKCRSEADWIVGLNATRNYTLRYGSAGILWSLGRVQTPVLAMIVRRDDQIRTFKSQPFWELMTKYRQVCFRYTGDRFDKEKDAQGLLDRVSNQSFVIQKIATKREQSLLPQLYDLTELQRDMNRRFGISAADTLASAQSIYERKLITYPRTDSRYLSTDMKKEVPGILRQLQSIKPHEVGRLNLQALPFSGRIVNNKKVSDHHAIIPTGTASGTLPARQQQVYDAIVVRFIAAFYPPCLKDVTTVDGVANQVPFRARGVRVVAPGWTELYPRKPAAQANDDEQSLPEFRARESGPHEPFIKSGQTNPPKHFTENTLLGAMDTAGKLVDEGELREALKEKGLGTPATRAAVIETLLTRQYIQRQSKNLEATDLGRYLIAIVRDKNLKSPELTGEWESQLNRIEAGQITAVGFMQEIVAYTHRVIQAEDAVAIDEEELGNCPQCGRPVIMGKRAYGCSAWRTGCPFVLELSYKELELTPRQIRELLHVGAISQPVQFGQGKPSVLTLSDSGRLVEVPVPDADTRNRGKSSGKRKAPRKTASRSARKTTRKTPTADGPIPSTGEKNATDLGPCPLCGAQVVEQKKSFSCSRWRDGCSLTIWKTMSGKKISVRTARALLRDGKTSVLKGFKSKSGKPFNARLKLDEGKVGFEFDV
jgi:DNA topoisomerase III